MSFFKRETPHNPYGYAGLLLSYYTIPRNNRELQHVRMFLSVCFIIPYQEIIGNYSDRNHDVHRNYIIPYQEIIGNYSDIHFLASRQIIIPYQEIIGNYSGEIILHAGMAIIPYQEIIGNYS